ncbi:hypothetical protein PMAYCL1PPCAC_21046 [Pristionchus mayeri]|uniref:Uncharacterized protein n=1 Tax=Pristionchus mayeri TaxID=1317129 RepID=A0AAN5I4X0_9BILA|nr:hypothetical protein PMAYCL1PPCAC_21046 [Pristionchus mayeri]
MRPEHFSLLQLLFFVASAAAAVGGSPPDAKSTPSPLPLASLFFSNGHQMRVLDGSEGRPEIAQAAPWLANLARSFPSSLRSFDRKPVQSREAVAAIEEFTGPLVRFATGGQPVAADVEQLIDSIPHLTRSANAFKEADKVNLSSMDITSLPSNVISHVLNGGEIPGIDRSELDRIVREHLKRMSEMADKVLKGEHVDNFEKILLPLEKVPIEMIMTSMQGKILPGLSAAETAKIREYYTKQLPSHAPGDIDTNSPLPETLATLGAMVQLLPPDYDIGQIPPEFIQSILAGRVPDISLLPADLQAYLGAGRDQAIALARSLNSSVTEIVQHLAATVQRMPEVNRVSPYDISQVTHEVIDLEANKLKQTRHVLYTIGWVALAFAVAAVICTCLLYRRFASPRRKVPPSAVTPPARDADDFPSTLPVDGSTRRRRVGSSPDCQMMVPFASTRCRFSTPKLQLELNSPELKINEKKASDVTNKNNDEITNKKITSSVDDSGAIYDATELSM